MRFALRASLLGQKALKLCNDCHRTIGQLKFVKDKVGQPRVQRCLQAPPNSGTENP
ncbi:hypothetical protein Plhal304r1_c028g0092171 [Plasmopara halstedii]